MAYMNNSIQRFIRRFRPNRKYRDRLFCRIFSDKKDLLALYNAVNHTHYTDPDMLEITTLEDAVYLSMKNDVSFILSSTLNLYEHQSTVNPNMPLRGFLYFSSLYEAYLETHKLNIYGHSRVTIPTPHFIVFYNGTQKQPDEIELKLSDLFEQPLRADEQPMLECRARVLNINLDHNQKLMQNCRRLWEYSVFVARVNQNISEGASLKQSIDEAIDYCIEQDILTDILTKSRSEVQKMLLTEYDEKKVMKMFFRDGRAEGLEAGRKSGRKEGELLKLIQLARKMLKKQMTPAEIADMFDEDLNRIEQIAEAIQKSPKISDEEIYKNIFDNNSSIQK
jgi:hypothetical protein